MKTYTTKSFNKDCLLVELPEGVRDLKVFHDPDRPYISYSYDKVETGRFYFPEGFSFVNLFSKLTDEDVEQLVDKKRIMAGPNPFIFFKDYQDKKPFVVTPLESFFSALEAEGVLWENPVTIHVRSIRRIPEAYAGAMHLYRKAEARIFDRNRTVVLIKN